MRYAEKSNMEERVREQFHDKFIAIGQDKFYHYLIFYAIDRSVNGGLLKPELELLTLYENFLILYRKRGDDNYLIMAKCFRKAAHKLYRVLLKAEKTQFNPRFLNVVKG